MKLVKTYLHQVWKHIPTSHLRKVGCGYMDWIGLAQDTERWRTLVSAVMNLCIP